MIVNFSNELTLSVVEEYDRDRELYLDYAATLHNLVREPSV